MDNNSETVINNAEVEVGNLIELVDGPQSILSEFDPLVQQPQLEPKPKPRRPVRPPPPPPAKLSTTLGSLSTSEKSQSVPGAATSPNLVKLEFKNESPVVHQPKRLDTDLSMNTQSDTRNSFKNKSTSFATYLAPGNESSNIEGIQKAKTLEYKRYVHHSPKLFYGLKFCVYI